jgi:hypothetical protein
MEEIEEAVVAMLATRCPRCAVPKKVNCLGTEQGKFHPERARRAYIKTKLSLVTV